ncbi:MAG: TIR domain-containing protein [Allosphingosinicella sp.]
MGSGRYTAFLSYSHRDAAEARWLHRRLEAYRIPRRLVGAPGERGPVPARLAPIFRDREELPAAGDLSEQVRAALARSETLVLLCSPNSAASPWVAKEVAAFRELHPDRPILAAIVAGEPPHCFPEGLAGPGAEPLAADLRPGRDGRRLGFLKLVAGLAGVGVDALVQRDAQRRIRRVTAVTAAALAAMLAMAVMTTLALTARAEAQRQRAEAEGLVEFMLTDLRDRLRGVGRLDVLTAVNERALAYYGERSELEGLSEESLARRARIFQAMGTDNLVLHDDAAALAAFEEAARTTAEQLARDPRNPQRLMEHASSLGGIGRVYEGRDSWNAARRYYKAAADVADRLVTASPSNRDHLMRAASAAVHLGNVELRGTKDYPAAQRAYERAIAILGRAEQASDRDVHVSLSRANAYGWLADSFYYRKLWGESLRLREEQHALISRLAAAHPNDHEIRFRLAAAGRGLAHSLLRSGDRDGAQAHFSAAADMVERLVQRDPGNAEWRALRIKLHTDISELRKARPDAAAASLRRPAPFTLTEVSTMNSEGGFHDL